MVNPSRHRTAPVAWLMAASLALGGCVGPATTTPSSSASASRDAVASEAPATEELDGADWARLEEVGHLVLTLGGEAWPGWGGEVPPLLLESEASDYLVGYEPPPSGFRPVAGLSIADQTVDRRSGHLTPSIGVQPIGDRLGVALLPRDRLQAFVDEMLGPGVVPLDDVQYVRWAAHEAFHVHELGAMSGDLPRFEFEGNETETAAALGETEGFAELLAAEGRLLDAALATGSDADLRAAVEAFLAARAERRVSAPAGTTGFEQAVEWSEGLARYTDVRLLQAAGTDYRPTQAFAELDRATYADPESVFTDAIRWLSDLSSVPGGLRDRYYELGAAQAYVLDRLMPGWHARALPGGASLEALLTDGLAAADAGTPIALRALQVVGVTVGERAFRVAVADDPGAWTRGLTGVEDLVPLDGLLFDFGETVDAAFFAKGASMALDIAFFDDAGSCLAVATMPICSSDPCPTYGAPAPYRWALEAPAGSLADVRVGDRIAVP